MNSKTKNPMPYALNPASRGFTLIELLVAITIAVVLMTIGIVSFTNAGKSARDVKRRGDLESIRQAMTLYRADEGEFPIGGYDVVIDELIDQEYLLPPAPEDPLDDGAMIPSNTWYAKLHSTFDITARAATANYEYEYEGGVDAFCFCALLENANGNSNASVGSGANICPGLGEGATQSYYCTKNL